MFVEILKFVVVVVGIEDFYEVEDGMFVDDE